MDSKLQLLLETVSTLKADQASLEASLKPVQAALDVAKTELMDYMVSTGSKRTEAVNGIFVVRAERITQKVADPKTVEAWLESEGFDMEEYMKLDETRVKAIAESALKNEGVYIPGFVTESNEYLTIRSAK